MWIGKGVRGARLGKFIVVCTLCAARVVARSLRVVCCPLKLSLKNSACIKVVLFTLAGSYIFVIVNLLRASACS